MTDASAEAVLHYEAGEYTVLKPGRHVTCAVTGRRIPLEALRYWSHTRQEAYWSHVEASQRLAETADR